MNKKICARIKQIRKKLNMSQQEFSEKIGISQGHLSKIERGEHLPDKPIIMAIAYSFGINLTWLLTGEGPIWSKQQTNVDVKELLNELLNGSFEKNLSTMSKNVKSYLKINTLSERLNYIIKEKYYSRWTNFAKDCGISVGSFERYVKGKGKPGFDQILRICEVTGVNPTWLLTGEGPVWKDSLPDQSTYNMVPIPYFENLLSESVNGTINYDEATKVMAFEPQFLKLQLGIQNFKNLYLINVIGDSMEPTLKSGELIFVNPTENEGGQIISGGIYVVIFDGEILVKRVQKNPVTKTITLISDNIMYEPIKIEGENLERLKVIGRVVGHLAKV